MKQNLTFAFILLAMLFMINATPLHKRKTNFERCSDFFPGLTTTMTPDTAQAGKNVTFTISGNFHDRPLKSDSVQIVAFAYSIPSFPCKLFEARQNICSDSSDTVKCPVTDYKATMIVQVPADLPTDDYLITAMISDDKNDVLGCAHADVDYVPECP